MIVREAQILLYQIKSVLVSILESMLCAPLLQLSRRFVRWPAEAGLCNLYSLAIGCLGKSGSCGDPVVSGGGHAMEAARSATS